jgi:hypothetical protein
LAGLRRGFGRAAILSVLDVADRAVAKREAFGIELDLDACLPGIGENRGLLFDAAPYRLRICRGSARLDIFRCAVLVVSDLVLVLLDLRCPASITAFPGLTRPLEACAATARRQDAIGGLVADDESGLAHLKQMKMHDQCSTMKWNALQSSRLWSCKAESHSLRHQIKSEYI